MKPNHTKKPRTTILTRRDYDIFRSEAIDSFNLLRVLDYHFYGRNGVKQ